MYMWRKLRLSVLCSGFHVDTFQFCQGSSVVVMTNTVGAVCTPGLKLGHFLHLVDVMMHFYVVFWSAILCSSKDAYQWGYLLDCVDCASNLALVCLLHIIMSLKVSLKCLIYWNILHNCMMYIHLWLKLYHWSSPFECRCLVWTRKACQIHGFRVKHPRHVSKKDKSVMVATRLLQATSTLLTNELLLECWK